jgi:glycosyltransferase involved in cell wall biosynthesis
MTEIKIKLYYSIPDHFPAFRLDVSELIGVSLQEKGLNTEWFMANNGPSLLPRRNVFFQQTCVIPPKFPGNSKLSKVVTKLAYWLTDSLLVLSAACRKFDILQTRDKYIVSVIALMLAKLTGKRFVYWCSYPFPEHALEVANQHSGMARLMLVLNGKFAYFLLYRIVMRFADHSFVQSQQMLQDIAAYGVPVARMTPVPMGVPPRLLSWAGTHPGIIVPGRIVYLGTMASVRKLHMLIDAFALAHQCCAAATLLMVGDGTKFHDRASLEQQVASLGLADVVQFTGFVPIEEAWSLAASAAVCVSPFYPSQILNSTSPTKLQEYMALGRPVVCNDHPEQTAIIKESGAGLCVGWSIQEFATAITWMLDHPEEAEAMGQKGPTWVATHRTYPIIAENVWRKYQEILEVAA